MRTDAHGKGALRRIGIKARIIIALVALVIIAFALVASFAAGFATGTVLRETGQRDACASIAGTWDDGKGICMGKAAEAVALPYSYAADERAYACGDGSRFTLGTISSSTERFLLAGAAPRDLAVVREGSLTRFEDASVTIVPDGTDATYINKEQGTNVSCTLSQAGGAPE